MLSLKRFTGIPAISLVLWCVILVAAHTLVGCSEAPGGERVENQPPTVWLSSAPPEGNDTKYRIQLFWGGWDPDGEISHYEYAITDNTTGTFNPSDTCSSCDNCPTECDPGRVRENPWHKVYGADSTFTFTADILRDTLTTSLVSRFERSHTFFIRAVDENGLASTEPAYRSFTAWTLSPTVTIKVPRRATQSLTPAQVPSIATYKWVATDYVNSDLESQEPDSVRWILQPVVGSDFPGGIKYIRTHPNADKWSDWHFYRAPEDSGKSWTTPPTDLGTYVFAVQAKDEAGAVTPVFDEAYNVRRIRVSVKSTGPTLTVTNEFTGPMQTAIATTPTVILDMPAGVPMQFTWSANAEDYGGLVSGYRYGWDIADLGDPAQWEVDFTPFTTEKASSPPRTFFFGTHTFDVEVVDNSGAKSRIEVKINVIQFTMAKSLLFVDDYKESGAGIIATKGAVPTDSEHDAFWQQMLGNVADFDWVDDTITVEHGTAVSITKFANYKSVVWDVAGGFNVSELARPKLYDLIQYRPKVSTGTGGATGKVQPNIISLFMKAGGHLMLCGLQPMTQVLLSARSTYKYPFIFKYELGGDQDGNYADQIQSGNAVGDQSFAYQDACVNVLDIAYSSFSVIRSRINNGCGVELIRTVDQKNDGMRTALPIDMAFPMLELRPEVADVGKVYAPTSKGWNSEVYNPPYFDFCSVAETTNRRPCFEPIYGHGCLNTASPIYNAPVAYWGGVYRDVQPEEGDGITARSVFFGFEPYYFKPAQVKPMVDIVLFNEWQLPRFDGVR